MVNTTTVCHPFSLKKTKARREDMSTYTSPGKTPENGIAKAGTFHSVVLEPVPNVESPNERYQIHQKTLLEQEYIRQDAFVSARLSRLQHGIYSDPAHLNMYGNPGNSMNVSFVAISFTLHPNHSALHRFQRIVINITASEDKQTLKIIKFAPHLAYGRVSTENLKWSFSLASTVGVTLPYTAAITPSAGLDKQKVVDAMMKIQGSTRGHKGVESGKLVWSLEENQQQSSGLPREFTFIFLAERVNPRIPISVSIGLRPVFSKDLGIKSLLQEQIGGISICLGNEPVGQIFLGTNDTEKGSAFNFATIKGCLDELIELPGSSAKVGVRVPPSPSQDSYQTWLEVVTDIILCRTQSQQVLLQVRSHEDHTLYMVYNGTLIFSSTGTKMDGLR
jgi:hypothetical protein